jgi:hypothetical protein
MSLLLAGCGHRDAELQRKIVGTWFQEISSSGTNHNCAITIRPDGSFSTILKGFPDHHTIVFDGKWSINWGHLTLTSVSSNSVLVSDVSSQKIFSLDEHRMVLNFEGQDNEFSR